jgi:hypothetical protein
MTAHLGSIRSKLIILLSNLEGSANQLTMQFYSKTIISTCSVAGVATQVATGPTTLHKIIYNVSTAVTAGLIDGTSGTTVNAGLIGKNPVSNTFDYGSTQFANGLRIVTSGATTINPSITVIWSQ